MSKVKTADAFEGLRQVVIEKTKAGPEKDPFLSRVRDEVRADRSRATRARVVEHALEKAGKVWEKHNPSSNAADARYFSEAELNAVAADDPGLGALSKLARMRASQSEGSLAAAAAVRSFFDQYAFGPDLHAALPGGKKLRDATGVPAKVAESYHFYDRAEQDGWATTSLQRSKIAGHSVYIVYCSTDGDYGHLEVLDKKGAPLASARLSGDQLLGWDEAFGRTRFSESMVSLDSPKTEDGLSEPAERAAAGQVPQDWRGDLQLTQGRLRYEPTGRLTELELPQASGTQLELAAAAFEWLWGNSLKYRVQGGKDPFLLGDHRQGTLVLGTFERNDGKTYQVADWRDIDDGSYTLYFDRTAEGRLKMAAQQINN